jgi:hypothetical protein
MAMPIVAGISAWLTIQAMPKTMPRATVRHWCRTIHHR